MPFLSNCHTHSTHCDGQNTLGEMVQAARALGFVSFGFSGHAAQGYDTGYSMTLPRQRKYFEEARMLQKAADGIRLWVGLELDALAGETETSEALANADYIVGSTHYLLPDTAGQHIAVDGPAALLKAHADEKFAGDGLALAREYYQIETEFLNRIRPDVIGHFDLLRKHAGAIGLFDENDSAYRKIALDALEHVFPSGSILEVNTGGIARGYLPDPYPTFELLCAWREMGGQVTLSSDCHDARLMTYAYDQALALIRKAGFDRILRLGIGDQLWESCELS